MPGPAQAALSVVVSGVCSKAREGFQGRSASESQGSDGR